jgi:hypothetical protein
VAYLDVSQSQKKSMQEFVKEEIAINKEKRVILQQESELQKLRMRFLEQQLNLPKLRKDRQT